MENRAAVLSALSFISALYVALSYKKALLPTIKDMILKIKKSTDEVGEKNERCEKELQAAYSTFVEKAEQYESRARELQAALADISDSKCAQARIENALLCELDLLCDLVTHVGLKLSKVITLDRIKILVPVCLTLGDLFGCVDTCVDLVKIPTCGIEALKGTAFNCRIEVHNNSPFYFYWF
jgi:hypothetical protein